MFHLTVFVWALVVSNLLCLAVVGIAWRHRDNAAAMALGALTAAAALWSTAELVATVGDGVVTRVAMRFLMLGATLTALSWFVFALEYTGYERFVTRRTIALLLVEPLIVQVLVWTNDSHHLFWQTLEPANVADGVIVEWGPAFTLHGVYSYALIGAGVFIVVRMVVRRDDLYRSQAAAVVAGVLVPLVVNVLYSFGPLEVDFTPVVFTVMATGFALAMFRYELVNLTPVAWNSVVDTIDAGVVILDEENRIVDINEQGRTILGAGAGVIGQDAQDVLDDVPGVWDRFANHYHGTEEVELELGGERRIYEVQATPLTDGRDYRVGRVFLIQDVTEKRRRRRELERQNEQLEQFASVVSHDLRNPLNVAGGYVELAEETGEVEHVSEVSESLDRMRDIIDDVLALAREGQTVEETRTVSLRELSERAWENVETGGATLEVDTRRRIHADPDRLLRVLENLMRNAIEHGTGQDHRSVTLRVGDLGPENPVERTAITDEKVGFFVEDDGEGIPENERDRILEEGYTTGESSTGLGLAIVRSIVEAHGWKIAVTASAEGGARFEITGVTTAGPGRQVPVDG